MKKKIISSVLAITLGCSVLSAVGCKSSSVDVIGNVQENELVVCTYEFSYGTEWLEEVLDNFVATKEGVTYRIVPSNSVDTLMQGAMQSGKNLADVYMPLGNTAWPVLVQQGHLENLSSVYDTAIQTSNGLRTIKDFMDDDIVDTYYCQRLVGQGDRYPWVLPLGAITLSFVYNEEILLATPHTTASSDGSWAVGDYWTTPPETMEEMLAYCTDLNERKITPFSWSGLAKHWLVYFLNVWFAQYQGVETANLQTVGADAGSYCDFHNFTSAENWKMEGLQVAWETLQSLIIDTATGEWKNTIAGVEGYDEQDASRQFVMQKAAMCFGGSFMYSENKQFMDLDEDGEEDFTMKMMSIPTVAGAETNEDGSAKKWSYRNFGEYVCVPAKATNKALAKEFLAFMCNEESNLIFTEATGTMRPFEYNALQSLPDKQWNAFERSALQLYQDSVRVALKPMGVDEVSPIACYQTASFFGSGVNPLTLGDYRKLTGEEIFITGKGNYRSVYSETVKEYQKWLVTYGVI